MSTESGDAPQGRVNPVTDAPSAKASKATEQHIDLRDLATILSPKDSVQVSIIKGVVTAVALTGSPPTITVQVSGDTSVDIPGVRFIDSYSPVVGDTVLLVKQGSEFFALGQMNSTTTAPSENGWATPSLGSGITTHSVDPVRYRVVVRDGDRVVQLRGGVTLSGTQTALWTMPADVRPVVNLLPMLIARNPDGGSNVAQLQVNANGTMVLAGATTGVKSVDTTTGSGGNVATSSVDPNDNTTSVNTDHKHRVADIGGDEEFAKAGWWTGTVVWSFQGTQGVSHGHGVTGSHSHTGGSHTHPIGSDPVTHPTWLSFNGVEYVL